PALPPLLSVRPDCRRVRLFRPLPLAYSLCAAPPTELSTLSLHDALPILFHPAMRSMTLPEGSGSMSDADVASGRMHHPRTAPMSGKPIRMNGRSPLSKPATVLNSSPGEDKALLHDSIELVMRPVSLLPSATGTAFGLLRYDFRL